MPRRKDKAPKAETVKVRLTLDMLERCEKARLEGYHRVDAESKFLGYLVELGLKKYETAILPIEESKDETLATGKTDAGTDGEQTTEKPAEDKKAV
jgi:hypothetical protein